MALILTIIFIALLFIGVKKKVPLTTVMVGLTFAMLILQTIIGSPLQPATPSGNAIVDMFEWYMVKAAANFVSVGLTSIFVLAYTDVMSNLRASDKLAYYLIKLTRPIKNKYVLASIILFIGVLLKMPIPVGPAMLALMIQLFLPVLKKRGVSKLSSAPAVQIGSFTSWGPAEPAFVMCAGLVGLSAGEYNLFDWFVTMQIPMGLLIGVVAAIAYGISSKILDEKDIAKGLITEQEISSEDYIDEELEKIPALYAVLPLIPVVVLIAFGLMTWLTYSIPGAIIISLVICMILYLMASRNVKGLVDIVEGYLTGLSRHFRGVGMIITVAVTFSNALSGLGGMTLIGTWLQNLNIPSFWLVLILAIIACLAVVLLGSLFGSFGVFLPIAGIVASARGLDPLFMGYIIMQACACGAMMCPYNTVPAMVNEALGIDPVQAMKRQAFPSVIGLIVTVVIGYMIYC